MDEAEGVIELWIPHTLLFDELCLGRNADGKIRLALEPLDAICAASGVSRELLLSGPPVLLPLLLKGWLSLLEDAGASVRGKAEASAIVDEMLDEATTQMATSPNLALSVSILKSQVTLH